MRASASWIASRCSSRGRRRRSRQPKSHRAGDGARDPVRCKGISDILLDRYGIHVQPNKLSDCRARHGAAHHSDEDIEALVSALPEIRAEMGIAQAA